MAQAFGIFGFFISLLGIFFASEVMRRSNERHAKVEADLFKANLRLLELEHKVSRLERMDFGVNPQKKRQAETLTSLANKKPPAEEPRRPRLGNGGGRFTPSESSYKDTG